MNSFYFLFMLFGNTQLSTFYSVYYLCLAGSTAESTSLSYISICITHTYSYLVISPFDENLNLREEQMEVRIGNILVSCVLWCLSSNDLFCLVVHVITIKCTEDKVHPPPPPIQKHRLGHYLIQNAVSIFPRSKPRSFIWTHTKSMYNRMDHEKVSKAMTPRSKQTK